MIVVEILLLSVLLIVCILAAVTDIKYKVIPNKLIIISLIPIIILDVIYYSFYAQDYFLTFAINFLILALLSVIMYALNLWAAGDSKLFFAIVLAVPARLFGVNNTFGFAPAIYIIVFTFSIAFLYTAVESIVKSFKSGNGLKIKNARKKLILFLKQYYCCSVYILAFSYTIRLIFPRFASNNASLILFMNLFLAILIFKFKFFFKLEAVAIVSILAFSIIAIYSVRNHVLFNFSILKPLPYLAVIILLRSLAEEYNYQTIKTSDVKPGMILSLSTIAMFQYSRVNGLPQYTTEDLRSRISNEEADSILRWENSKFGCSEIQIVRKTPFAIFMALGTAFYILLRMEVLWN